MRVLFICGSFEPGRDGVGDYVRQLSLELIRQGHDVSVVAINEKFLTGIEERSDMDNRQALDMLRLPSGLDEQLRMDLLSNWVEKHNPDWLSLQYVPFSFHKRGLAFFLPAQLKAIGEGRKWQLMFHEISVGMRIGTSMKEFLWGMAQQYLVKRLLKTLKPDVVHTQIEVYKILLQKLGAGEVRVLPLFSNIPVLYPERVRTKSAQSAVKNAAVDIVVFASIHAGAPIAELAAEAAEYGRIHNQELRLVFLGRSGKELDRWSDAWKAAGLKVTVLGEQRVEKVSEVLADAFFGIATTPLALAGKSGAVAAMRDHRMHLLCVSRPWLPRGIVMEDNPFHILEYKRGGLGNFFSSRPDFSYQPGLSAVAEQLVSNLLSVK